MTKTIRGYLNASYVFWHILAMVMAIAAATAGNNICNDLTVFSQLARHKTVSTFFGLNVIIALHKQSHWNFCCCRSFEWDYSSCTHNDDDVHRDEKMVIKSTPTNAMLMIPFSVVVFFVGLSTSATPFHCYHPLLYFCFVLANCAFRVSRPKVSNISLSLSLDHPNLNQNIFVYSIISLVYSFTCKPFIRETCGPFSKE